MDEAAALMGRRWLEPALMVVAGLSVVGVVRSVVVVSPVAGDLPEPLRSEGPRLAGFRSLREATAPPRRGRDGAWGPTHRYRLVPAEGNPVLVELVMRQSWNSEAVVLPEWKGARTLTLRPKEQVRLGRMGGGGGDGGDRSAAELRGEQGAGGGASCAGGGEGLSKGHP